VIDMDSNTSSLAMFPQPLLDALAGDPDGIAFEHGARTVTRGEVLDTIAHLAAGLDRADVGPGHGVGVLTSLTPESFAAYLAALAVGARVVGVSPGYTDSQRAHVLRAGINTVIVDPTVDLNLIDTGHPTQVLSLGPCEGAADLLAPTENDPPLVVRGRPDDVARLIYTSGSTGLPKGCIQTYHAVSSRWAFQPSRWTPEVTALADAIRRYLLAGTLASVVIMDQVVLCLLAGGTVVIPTGDLSSLFPHGIQQYRITSLFLPVSRVNRIVDIVRREDVDTSSLRALSVSGSPTSAHQFADAISVLGPIMHNVYGQSESGVISILTPADVAKWGADALSSVGRVHADAEVEIRDPEGNSVPQGQIGEVLVRSPSMMSGYWNEPELTEQALVDGWLRTRDLGYFDEHGLLHLVGRTRDVIIVNAQICYAGAIEDVLSRSADVLEAHVIGTPDDTTGEAIHAFVVPVGDTDPDLTALAARVRTELGEINVPSTLTVVRDVPQTVSGKPDKPALLARYQGAIQQT
jgi:acyl-CoA synthetase (AMP-forming)/AMP-acid ligase II